MAQEIKIDFHQGNYHMETKTKMAPIFSQIAPNHSYTIWPDDVVKIGDLEFQLMRFNVGITTNEENILIYQNLQISGRMPCSFFCIIDGYNIFSLFYELIIFWKRHNGNECSSFLKANIEPWILRKFLIDGKYVLDNCENVFFKIVDSFQEV